MPWWVIGNNVKGQEVLFGPLPSEEKASDYLFESCGGRGRVFYSKSGNQRAVKQAYKFQRVKQNKDIDTGMKPIRNGGNGHEEEEHWD